MEKAAADEAMRKFKVALGIDPDLPDPEPEEVWWTYTCGLCGAEVHPDGVRAHTDEERAKPTWPGYLSWTRTDAL